jgi:large subunit ribosomal protein L4
VKNRSLVSGGGKKPWKQKGTGRARAGSTRASNFVGGGKAMGPKPRDYSYDVPRKVRKLALRSALSLRNSEQKLLIVDRWTPEAPRTAAAGDVLQKLGVKRALVVDGAENTALHRSIRNLSGSDFLATQGLNVYDILGHEYLVLTADSARKVEEALS